MSIEEIIELLRGRGIEVRIQSRMAGVKKRIERKSLWINVERDHLKEIVELFIENAEEFPHFCVASTSDMGDNVEVNYHFTINFGRQLEEIQITLRVKIPKNDLWVPTLTDIVPATIFSERELREMMGIEIKGLQDKRHLFLTKDFPDGVYPWRRDETGPKDLNKLYEGWKE
ncbi:MAG: NADH-quinone oxidoreductase subunit C [Thermoplasmata archaeon]|nr:MAG: NADH-quinone oxidoreductase subunit C [Thermoplasmata archaeon]